MISRWKARGNYYKKDLVWSPYDEINKRMKKEVDTAKKDQIHGRGQDRFHYLYRQAMMQERIRIEKIKEATRIKEKMEIADASFTPEINKTSRSLAKKNKPLMERTAEKIEKERLQKINQRNAIEPGSGARMYPGFSPTPKPRAKSTIKKEVLDPEDYDNFFKKNIEWLNFKREKIDFLQSEKKRMEEKVFEDECGKYQKQQKDKENGADDSLYSLYKHISKKKIPDIKNIEKEVRVRRRLYFEGEDQQHEDHTLDNEDNGITAEGRANDKQRTDGNFHSLIDDDLGLDEIENDHLAGQNGMRDKMDKVNLKEELLIGALMNDLNDLKEAYKKTESYSESQENDESQIVRRKKDRTALKARFY